MINNKKEGVVLSTIIEILIVIKKMGIPFVILGIIFLIYSQAEGKPVIPFEKFVILFLTMVLFQSLLENVWIEREIQKLRHEINYIKKNKIN